MRAYLINSDRSSATGRLIFEWLKERDFGGYRWYRRNKNKRPLREHSLIVRWGTTDRYDGDDTAELIVNSVEAVSNAADKGKMIEILNESEICPEILWRNGDAILDQEMFVRDRRNSVSFRKPIESDRYGLKPIEKSLELRVHATPDKVIGVYEKVPKEDSDGLIRKNDNSDFVRLDRSERDVRRRINGAQAMAKMSVAKMGLSFGGVDVLIDRDGNCFVNEVNSSPGLSEVNVERVFENLLNLRDEEAEHTSQSADAPSEQG